MRLEVENGIKPLREVNQPLVSWPSGTTRYLYGVYFYQFIAERYGKDKIAQLIDDYSTHVIPFMLSTNSMHVLGKNMDQLWNEFEDYLNKTFKPEIAEIKAQGVRAGEQLTNTGYYTERPRALPNGDIFFLQNDFKSHAKLMRYDHDTNIAQKVVNVNPGARFDLHPQAGILLVQLELYKNVNTFSDLYQVDIHTNKKVRLTKGARYRAATWSPDGKSIIAVRNDLGNCSLHLLTNTGKYVETLWQGTNKDVVTELDWSPNGKELVAAVWRPDGQWNLESFSLKDRSWKKLTNTKQIEGQPQYNSNGTSIVFAADYQGIFNIRTLDLTSGKTSTLTNVIGGGFNPSLSQNGNTLYYTGAGPSGFNVFKLKLDNLPVSSPVPDASGMTSSSDPMVVKQTSSDPTHVSGTITPYTPYDSLSPTWWFPYFLFTPHRDELGFMTSGSDALNRHNFSLLAAYDIKNHWPTGELDYIYDRWYPALKFRAARSSSELLTNGDNLERIRSSDSLTAEAVFPFMKFNYQWGFHIAAVYDIESDRQVAQNYIAIPDRTDTLGGIALTFNSANRYPIAISKSDGRMIKFVYEKSDLFGGNYDGNIYSVDWKEYIKLGKENVLALRLAGGLGTQTSRPFQLGGSFSEELPDLLTIPTDVIFNKRQYALRGYPQGLAGLTGRRMLLGAVEWRFPIKLVEYGVTAPVPIGIHQIYGDVFYNAGEAWFETEPHKPVHSGVGLELNTETVLGYWIVLNLRLGFAHGFDQGGTNQVYLTIGSSF